MLFGMAFAINNATHFTFLPELSKEHERPVAIAVFTATLGLSSGLAPVLWGLFLRKSGQTAGIVEANFAVFFAIGIALSVLMVAFYARLPDHRPHASR